MGEPTTNTTQGRGAASTDVVDSSRVEGATAVTRTASHPALLTRLRAPRSPKLWFEIALIGFSYWLYSLVRNAVPEQRTSALRNARWVWSFEGHLGLDVERSVNHAVNSVTWLVVGMNYYYATLHFIITIGVLVWLYLRHPERYATARLALFCTTWLALVGFYACPLAPPRLMTGGNFVDTVKVHNTWGSMSQGSLSHVSNQYAAMPSMHIGWSLWCGITLVTLAKPLWAKVLGGLYPLFTLLVIVSTGNHFWLDAVGGALCLALGYGVVYLVYGRWVYRLPRQPEPLPGR